MILILNNKLLLALVFCTMFSVGCAKRPSLDMPLIDGNKVSSVNIPRVHMGDEKYREGYKDALDKIQSELAKTGPYSLTMSPEPVYRGPVYLRTYLNRMRIGRTYYPEGWYEVEATPGSPGRANYRK